MSANDGRVVGTTKIVDHGPDNERWNLVIVGDGYQESELAKYHQDVQNFLATFQQTKPFDELFAGINMHRVDVISTDSGADDPVCPDPAPPVGTGARANTFFDATYCGVAPGSVRLGRLLVIDSDLAVSVARDQVSRASQVLCVVNSSKYGGSGGKVATFSTNFQASQIAIHEMGHSAFGLADEYGGNGTGTPGGEPPQPNVTRDTDRDTNKWGALIAASTPMPSQRDPNCAAPLPETPPRGAVGTYEGAIFSDCNVYRPLDRCKMKTLVDDFCPVCEGVIRETLQQFLPVE
jgi:IgA Peptidase M64